MNPATFEWDDENIEHIELHGVDIVEVEAVLDNRPLILRTQEDKYIAYSQMKVATFSLFLLASLREFALSVLVI